MLSDIPNVMTELALKGARFVEIIKIMDWQASPFTKILNIWQFSSYGVNIWHTDCWTFSCTFDLFIFLPLLGNAQSWQSVNQSYFHQSWNPSIFRIGWLNQTLIRWGQGLHDDASKWRINGQTEIKTCFKQPWPSIKTSIFLTIFIPGIPKRVHTLMTHACDEERIVPRKYTTLHKRCSTLKLDILMKYVCFHRRRINVDFYT